MIEQIKRGKDTLLLKFTLHEKVNNLFRCITDERDKHCRSCKDNDPCSYLTRAIVSIKLNSGL